MKERRINSILIFTLLTVVVCSNTKVAKSSEEFFNPKSPQLKGVRENSQKKVKRLKLTDRNDLP